jgi:hypothetical protein
VVGKIFFAPLSPPREIGSPGDFYITGTGSSDGAAIFYKDMSLKWCLAPFSAGIHGPKHPIKGFLSLCSDHLGPCWLPVGTSPISTETEVIARIFVGQLERSVDKGHDLRWVLEASCAQKEVGGTNNKPIVIVD